MTNQNSRITDAVASFARDLHLAGIPERTRHEARRSLINIVGCTIGGARHAAVATLWRGVGPFAGGPQATLMGRGARTDAVTAALMNTYASSINTYDDTHAEAIIHPSGPVMGAVLALAELRPVTGADLLAAFTLGVEISCRLSKAVSVPPAKGPIGWSQTGLCCGIGAAAATARLLGLDVQGIGRSMGIAASQASGIRSMHGSMCTAMMPAQAGQMGLRAALLAEAGFTGGARVFEGPFAFADCFAVAPHLEYLTSELGGRWEIEGNTYKPFPCGIVINPLIDAALQLQRAHPIEASAVSQVAVRAAPHALALCDRPSPKDEMEAQVSLYHWVAAAFVRGRAGVAEGTDAAVRDPAIAAFRARVQATADPAIPIDGCDMIVTLADGRRIEQRVRDCVGSRGHPMPDADLEAKLKALAEGVLPADRVERLIAACWSVATLEDGAEIARLAA